MAHKKLGWRVQRWRAEQSRSRCLILACDVLFHTYTRTITAVFSRSQSSSLVTVEFRSNASLPAVSLRSLVSRASPIKSPCDLTKASFNQAGSRYLSRTHLANTTSDTIRGSPSTPHLTHTSKKHPVRQDDVRRSMAISHSSSDQRGQPFPPGLLHDHVQRFGMVRRSSIRANCLKEAVDEFANSRRVSATQFACPMTIIGMSG